MTPDIIAALEAFAAYADPRRSVPASMPVTSGSSMARKQLTMGDCYAAADALAALSTSPAGQEVLPDCITNGDVEAWIFSHQDKDADMEAARMALFRFRSSLSSAQPAVTEENGGHCYCWCHPNAGAIGCSPCCDAEDNYLPPSKRDPALSSVEPAGNGAGGALREALEGMVAIAQAWEAADSRKNIQLEHSNAYKAALRTLNLPLTGWIVWDGQSVPSVDRRDSRKGFIWFTHETEREAIERGQSEIFYWPWYGEDEQPCVRAYALATPLSHDAEGESATVSREGELREALQMAQEVRDLLLERIQGSPARSAAHNARVRADSLIMLLSSIIPAAQEDYPDPCPVCSGDCSSANPPVMNCPMKPHKEATPATSTERGR